MANFDLHLALSKELYSKAALLKTAFSFVDRAYIHLDHDDAHWIISMRPKQAGDEILPADFENELLSQEVRLAVYRKTHALREILLARAMASSLVTDDNPMNQIHEDEASVSDEELDHILKDWYSSHES